MTSGYEIRWSKRSVIELQSIISYLELNWSEKEIKNFILLIESHLLIISKNPELFRISQRYLGTRECLISRHLTMFYTLDHKAINIVALWDNRKNPKFIKSRRNR